MKRAALLLISLIGVFCLSAPSLVSAQQPEESTVTLYSRSRYRGQRQSCVNFGNVPALEDASAKRTTQSQVPCDLRYGGLHINDDLDWFHSLVGADSRGVIKDLGAYTWTAKFNVPVVIPFPKLKPGENRLLTFDLSGADGADGTNGWSGQRGADASREDDGHLRTRPAWLPQPSATKFKSSKPPRIDPSFVKAVVGRLYVIHVVDDTRDFYALFRVEALDRGASCTISWKLIPEPPKPIK